MDHTDPRSVKSPKGAVTHLDVLYDGGPSMEGVDDEWAGWSVAELEWYEIPTLAIRWNGGLRYNGDHNPLGHPQSRGVPMWFILPQPLHDIVRERLAQKRSEAA